MLNEVCSAGYDAFLASFSHTLVKQVQKEGVTIPRFICGTFILGHQKCHLKGYEAEKY